MIGRWTRPRGRGVPGAAHAAGCRAARADHAVRRGAGLGGGASSCAAPASTRAGRRRADPGPAAGPGPGQARPGRRPDVVHRGRPGAGDPAGGRGPARGSGSPALAPERVADLCCGIGGDLVALAGAAAGGALGVDRDPLTAAVAAANAAALGVADRVEVRCADVTTTDLAGGDRRLRRPGPAQQQRAGPGPAVVVAADGVRPGAGPAGTGHRGQARTRRAARGAAGRRRGGVGVRARRRGRVRAVVRAAVHRRAAPGHRAALGGDADRRRHPGRGGRAGRPLPGGAGRRGDPGRAGRGGRRPGRRPAAGPDDRLPDLRPACRRRRSARRTR